MGSDIGGWNVTASASNLPAVAQKAAKPNFQHIIYGISASFTAAPAAPVLCQIVNPDVSPNTVYWQGYVSGPVAVDFPAGICGDKSASVAAVLSAGGSAVVGKVNLHGVTR